MGRIHVKPEAIQHETLACPYCMSEVSQDETGCCGESSAHFEKAYVIQDEIFLESEVEIERPKLERTNSILAILSQAEIRLNALRCQVPCGIRSSDDETDRKIKFLTQYVADLKGRIKTS